MSTKHLIPKDLLDLYEVCEWRNAVGVLTTAYPREWEDIVHALRTFRLLRSEILTKGGRKSLVAIRFDSILVGRGWTEKQFATRIQIDKVVVESPTHKVDCFKNHVALEVERNNKTEFYDRETFASSTTCEQSTLGSSSRVAPIFKTHSKNLDEGNLMARPRRISTNSSPASKEAAAEAVLSSSSALRRSSITRTPSQPTLLPPKTQPKKMSTETPAEDLLAFTAGKTFGTILADPPWRFQNRTGKMAPEHRRLSRYDTMTLDDIAALPVAQLSAPVSHLYLWVPNALLPEGIAVMKAWGFEYKSNIIWHKIRKDGGSDGRGVGFYFRNVTEVILFGIRGKNARTLAPGRRQVNMIQTRKREHSRKPDEQYPVIEACSPGPFLELFARGIRDNWATWGHEAAADYEPTWDTYTNHSQAKRERDSKQEILGL